MFLSEQPAKVYALLYRHKMHRVRSQIKEHPVRKALGFMAEVAFFGDGSQNEEVFPEELRFNLDHISKLLFSLSFDQTKETDLLETYIKMLIALDPT